MLAEHAPRLTRWSGDTRIFHVLSLEDIPNSKNFADHILRRSLIARKMLDYIYPECFAEDSIYVRMVLIYKGREKRTHILNAMIFGHIGQRHIVDRSHLNCSA